MELESFLEKSWERYSKITPDSGKIHAFLEARGEKIINDHLAYRTFKFPGIDKLRLGSFFEKWGYVRAPEELDFQEKKLKANYWLHSDPRLPKIFISELLVEEFPVELQKWLRDLSSDLASDKKMSAESFLKPSWAPVKFSDYKKFYEVSEYAAWTAAFGIQTNHFTISVNELKTVKSLHELNTLLLSQGIKLNESGGVIKGNAKELLEQSSTLANRVKWQFAGGEEHEIMSCYYEFAQRHVDPQTGKLFTGFLPKSADKIFESNFERSR